MIIGTIIALSYVVAEYDGDMINIFFILLAIINICALLLIIGAVIGNILFKLGWLK